MSKITQLRLAKTERSFDDIGALCAFVSDEIHASGMTYSKIARDADVRSGTVSRLAHGSTKFPRAATVLQILRALGWTVSVRGSNQ